MIHYAWANVGLLILLVLQFATGFWGLVSATESERWILWLHGLGGYAVLLLLWWKGANIWRAFRQSWSLSLSRLAVLTLLVLLVATLATGMVWTFAGARSLGGFSLMTIHALLALGLIGLLAWHTVARRSVLRAPEARDRRAFLRLSGISVAGALLWGGAELVKRAWGLPGESRRFTGSYETGSMTGVFPSVSWLFDDPAPVELESWRLSVEGAVERPLSLTYEELIRLGSETVRETLDCTGGWYSTQEWAGVPLARLLDLTGVLEQARSVTVESVSGYGRRFSMAEADTYVLATHVAGQALNHGHGFPLRLVAAGRRGFEWVKWVTRVRVNESGKVWQPPVPLQ
jgi:DMSO/TMAO reductase YedYZ molybdopterin-dependent catalytic subunit